MLRERRSASDSRLERRIDAPDTVDGGLDRRGEEEDEFVRVRSPAGASRAALATDLDHRPEGGRRSVERAEDSGTERRPADWTRAHRERHHRATGVMRRDGDRAEDDLFQAREMPSGRHHRPQRHQPLDVDPAVLFTGNVSPRAGPHVATLRRMERDRSARTRIDAEGGHSSTARWMGVGASYDSEIGASGVDSHYSEFDPRFGAIAAGGTRADGDADYSGGMGMDGLGAWGGLQRTGDGHAEGASAYVSEEYLGLSADISRTFGDFGWGLSGGVAGWRDFAKVSATMGLGLPGGNAVELGASVSVGATRSVTLLGAPKERVVDVPMERVEIQTHVSKAARVDAGATIGGFSFGARLSLSHSKDITWRTNLPQKLALQTAAQNADYQAEKLMALGIEEGAPQMPSPCDPDGIPEGDEITYEVEGSVSGGILFGVEGARAGLSCEMVGRHTIAIRRLPGGRYIDFVFCPVEVKSFAAVANAELLSAHVGKGHAMAWRQGFRLDMKHKNFQRHWDQLMRGQLPGTMAVGKGMSPDEAAELLDIIYTDKVKDGIERTCLEKREITTTFGGASTSLVILPDEWVGTGFGFRKSKEKECHVIAVGPYAITRNIRKRTRGRDVGRSGSEDVETYSAAHRITQQGVRGQTIPWEDGVTVHTTISDTKQIDFEMNTKLRPQLERALGISIPLTKMKAPGHAYAVDVDLRLPRPVLIYLSLIPQKQARSVLGRAHPLMIPVQQLITDLRESALPTWSNQIHAFIDEHGFDGQGALEQLLSEVPGTLVHKSVQCETYEAPIERARQLLLEFGERISSRDSKDDLNRRFEEIGGSLDSIDDAIRRLSADTVYEKLDPSNKARLLTSLAQAKIALRAQLKISHLKPVQRHLVFGKLKIKRLGHRAEMLLDAYENPISVEDTKEELKKRYRDIITCLRDLRAELLRMRSDAAVNDVAGEDQSGYRAELEAARTALDHLKSFEHLTPRERAKVIATLEERRHRWWHRFRTPGWSSETSAMVGALSQLGVDYSEVSTDGDDVHRHPFSKLARTHIRDIRTAAPRVVGFGRPSGQRQMKRSLSDHDIPRGSSVLRLRRRVSEASFYSAASDGYPADEDQRAASQTSEV